MKAYQLDEFTEFKEAPKLPAVAVASNVDLAEVVPIDIDKLNISLPESVRTLILNGDDPERPIGSNGARFPSRSEVVFSSSCGMARAGFDERTIAGVLINQAYKISGSILEKRAPKKYALKQASAAVMAAANTLPDMAKTGPRPTLRNTIVALQKLELRFAHDLFRRRNFVHGLQLEAFRGEMTDDISAMLRRAILDDFSFDPGKEHVRDAVHMLCLENSFHPIRDYLAGLKWDGTPRLDALFPDYFGTEDTALNRAFGSIMMIAAARRVRHPGMKFDQIVVLEGAQGTGKSTAITILAGPESHSDQDILTLDSKGQVEMLEGVWLYELGELEGLGRADVAKVKAFASRQTDRARMAYAYFREDRARECIFIGTTNDSHYLTDQTGNRRFWPVKTARIDLEALRRDRDQLWAEAAHREAAGEPITLPQELWETAAVEQAARTMRDPWLDILEKEPGQEANKTTVRVSSTYLLTEALQIEPGRQKPSDQTRLGVCMRLLGWDGPKRMRVDGHNVRGYERSKPEGWRTKSDAYKRSG